MNVRRYLWLDIDGVLNGHQKRKANGYSYFDRKRVLRFNDILTTYPDLQVILSSAWRYMIINKAMTLEGFRYMMLVNGCHKNLNLIGHTVADEVFAERESQITYSKLEHRISVNDPQCKHVVVDDLPLKFASENFVQTVGSIGLTDTKVQEICEILR